MQLKEDFYFAFSNAAKAPALAELFSTISTALFSESSANSTKVGETRYAARLVEAI